MKTWRWAVGGAALAVSLAQGGGLPPAAPVTALQILPDSTFAVVHVPSGAALAAAVAGTRLGGGTRDLLEMAAPYVEMAAVQDGAAPTLLLGKRLLTFARRTGGGETVFAVLGLRAERGFWPIPECVWITDGGAAGAGGALATLESAAGRLREQSARLDVLRRRHKGASYTVLTDGEVSFAFGLWKGFLVAASSESAFQAVVDAKQGLSLSAAFRAARGRMGGTPLLTAHVALAPAWEMLDVYAPGARAHPVVRALGISDLASVTYALEVEAGRFREAVHARAPKGRLGVLQWFAPPAGAALPTDLALVPPGVIGVTASPLSLKKGYEHFLVGLRDAAPDFYNRQMMPALKQAEQQLGLTIADGVLGALEGDLVSYLRGFRAEAGPGGVPLFRTDATYILKLADETRFGALLDKFVALMRQACGGIEARETAGGRTYVCRPGPTAPAFGEIMFGLRRGRFVASTQADDFEYVSARLAGDLAGESILDDPRYQEAVRRLRHKGALLEYYDVGRLAAACAPLCGQIASALGQPMPPILSAVAAAGEAAGAPDWGGWAASAVFDDHGVLMEMVGPIPAAAAVGVVIGPAVALPALQKARDPGGE